MQKPVIDVARLIDEQPLSWFGIRVIALTFLAMFFDGYDLNAATYAAAGLQQTLHVSRPVLGTIFSFSPAGMLVGSLALGWLGDRIGRKRGILVAILIYSAFSLASAAAGSVAVLLLCRFGVGIGIGGLFPNTAVINAEFAPKRIRASCTVIMAMGITFGGFVVGQVGAFIPVDQWRLLFLIGGLPPLLLALILAAFLPESIKYLALKDDERSRQTMRNTLMKLVPRVAIPADAVLVVEEHKARGLLGTLFSERYRWVTVLLWLVFAADLMANFAFNNWLPTLLRDTGLNPSDAASVASMYFVGGIFGGLTIGFGMDRFGLTMMAGYMICACFAVFMVGTPDLPVLLMRVAVFLAGFFILGIQLGIFSTSVLYPTAIRAGGLGWANGIGRLGAIAGPFIVGWFAGMHLPTRELLLMPIVPLVVSIFACLTLIWITTGRILGGRMQEV